MKLEEGLALRVLLPAELVGGGGVLCLRAGGQSPHSFQQGRGGVPGHPQPT